MTEKKQKTEVNPATVKTRKVLAERWAIISKQAEELEAARQEMETAAAAMNAADDSLSFEKFKEAKRRAEDAKDYYNMIQRAQAKAEKATDNEYKLYRECAGDLQAAFIAEQTNAEKEALKPCRDLLAMLEKHASAQQEYVSLDEELKQALRVVHINCVYGNAETIPNRQGLGGLLKELNKFITYMGNK